MQCGAILRQLLAAQEAADKLAAAKTAAKVQCAALEAEARAADKGRDCAQCAVEMANLVAALEPEADDEEYEEDEDIEQAPARR